MINYLKIFILFFSLQLTTNLYAENLLDIYLLARDNDPIILGAKQSQLADSEGLIAARAKFLPNISATGNQTYVRNRDTLGQLNSYNRTRANYNTNAYGLNINQPIFQVVDWMQYLQTKKQILSSLKKYENTEQELILRVAEQYFAVLAAIDQLETSRAATQAFNKRLEQAKQQFKVGVTAITDMNEAQARLDSAKAKEILDSNDLNTEKENLSKIVGKFIIDLAPLKPQIPLVSPAPNNIDPWVDKARKYNLKLQAARYNVEAAQEAVRASSSSHLPTINLTGSISNNKTMPPNVDNFHTKQIAINLQLPIFSGGTIVATTQTAIFKTNEALQQLEAAYRDAESGTRVAYHSVLTQISQVDALQQSVKSSKVALQATQAAFEVGTRTIVDVLNSQTDLLNAQRNYAQSRYNYILSGLKLKQTTGSLCVNDLEQINTLLVETNNQSMPKDTTTIPSNTKLPDPKPLEDPKPKEDNQLPKDIQTKENPTTPTTMQLPENIETKEDLPSSENVQPQEETPLLEDVQPQEDSAHT